MRPITRPAVSSYQVPPDFDFSGLKNASTVAAVVAALGSTRPTVSDCLALWDQVAGGGALNQVERDALDAVKIKVSETYKKAADDLVDAIGAFCTYCELPLTDPPQVEHVAPKAEYPLISLDWDNFVLACTGCNSRKREKPTRETTVAWTGLAQPTSAQCRQELRDRYRWPDVDDIVGCVEVKLFVKVAAGTWTAVADQDAVDAGTTFVSKSMVAGEVVASVAGGAPRPVVARVVDSPDTRAAETISLCGLDLDPVPASTSDQRAVRRTTAWLTAVRTWHAEIASGGQVLSDSFKDLVVATGFFYVWYSVGKLIDPALGALLVTEVAPSFPGTDTGRL